ncbi:MAG: glycosyltransferase [Conexibacter sp.]|nr:glycosyltransferase [Conexibacter sp.]
MTTPARAAHLSILVVHAELPLYDRHAGSLRLFRMLELLAADGHEVTFLARCGIGQERYTAELTTLGIDVHPLDRARLRERGVKVPGNDLNFAELCVRGRFDVAILPFYELAEQYLPLLRRHSPLTRVVIDTVDVHHVRERRGAELSGDCAQLAAAERTRAREQAIYGAADALVAVSDADAAALRELAPDVPAAVLATIHEDAPDGPAFAAREGLVFVGNFAHAPNVDAIVDFHASTWPLVRAALPGVQLTLVGTDPPPAIRALAGDDVEVTGWVPQTAPYLERARISIAPLRYGAGVKGKIGEAMSHGLPVVTTTIGSEGMALVPGEHALVADGPEVFARAVADLYDDPQLWALLSSSGRAHIGGRLSVAAARDALRALLRGVARTPFVAAVDMGDTHVSIAPALRGYLGAFEPGEPVSLVLTVPAADADAPAVAFAAAAAEIERLGHDLEGIADVSIQPLDARAPLPASTISVTADGGARTIDPSAASARWRERAEAPQPGRRRPSAPRAALLLYASDDAHALAAQLDALADARLPDDVELVVAADDSGPDVAALLASSGARVVRTHGALGRRVAWQLAAQAARAPLAVALAPLALPAAGFLDPLLDRVGKADAGLVAPVVAGAHGLSVADDGSLRERAANDPAPLGALPLDCLGATRELFASGFPETPAGEGHFELQMASWALQRGGIALASGPGVARTPTPPASVVVCTQNRAHELKDLVPMLCRAGARDVVIVNNASTDETDEVAAELAARFPGVVRLVQEPRAGLGHARNAGAAAARHELLLYIDDDARPAPGWIDHLAYALGRPGVVNAGGPICGLWPAERPSGWPGRELEALFGVLDLGDATRTLCPPDVVYAGSWGVRRTALDAVGGFDLAFGFSPGVSIGGDEVSVAWRLHRAGTGATRYTPGAVVGHRIQATRIDDRYLYERGFRCGVERPRHAQSLGEATTERLVGDAQRAVTRLLGSLPLTGELTVETALDAVAASSLPLRARVLAADAIGELAACVALAGERQVIAGGLTLSVHEEVVDGALRPSALAV